MSKSKWDGDSGLSYTGTVTDAYFEYDDQFERTQLVMEVAGPNGERTERFNVGKGWLPNDGGTMAVHDQKTTFHKSCGLMKFVKSILVLDGGREILEERGDDPTVAAVWKGLTIGFDQIDAAFTSDTGEEVEYQVTVATSISDGGAPPVAANDELKAEIEAIWEAGDKDHAKFVEEVFSKKGEVLLDPDLTKWVEDAGNWA